MKKITILFSFLSLSLLVACNSDKSKDNKTTKTETTKPSDNIDKSVVYVNTDTLISGYELYKKASKDIQVKGNDFSSDIERQKTAFRDKVLKAEQNARAMTMGEIEAMKKSLAEEEQRIMQYESSLSQNLGNMQKESIDKINKNIDDFIKRYAEKNGYKMVLSYKQGVTAWYADNRLDVTTEVLKGLNEEYNAQGKETKTTTDSTKK
ncbi:MAG: OmpH family outer membrane protein [Raineya sp.]|jgi:outer membrane protein|nr:OmpH family outer membrane protein [Raineya sp.]